MLKRIGVAALARPTFDVPYAEQFASEAFASLDAAGLQLTGSRALLFDADAARAALKQLSAEPLDALLLLQVTFTDAAMTVELGRGISAPLILWAFPEPRAGGRLRLNSFCGLNLAAHALGRAGRAFGGFYAPPGAPGIAARLEQALAQSHAAYTPKPAAAAISAGDRLAAAGVIDALRGKRIGLAGEHPAGFDTCRFDDAALHRLAGVSVDRIALPALFARAASTQADEIETRRKALGALRGIDGVDQAQLGRSLGLAHALEGLTRERGLAAIAVRCWPEMFTEYGCAVCGPMAMLNEAKTPAACEADMYGALSAYLMQEIAKAPSWLVDIVDISEADGTSVVWHCGSAPLSMRDPEYAPEAQIHSNRRMPLLYQFPLKPGRVTIGRISQAANRTVMMVTGGEMIRAPLSFTGTSGVVKFDAPAARASEALIRGGFEHHVAIVYGDHRGALAAAGEKLGLPVIGLGE